MFVYPYVFYLLMFYLYLYANLLTTVEIANAVPMRAFFANANANANANDLKQSTNVCANKRKAHVRLEELISEK